ncbi:MAG: ATP-binding protein [Nitrospira sp.]|nr:ATP-binding protein [Nitrospira sp.]
MASLAAAHKGYFYQDIATAYFLARSLVEPVQFTTVDARFYADDRFDDLLIVANDGKRVRRQFKHSDSSLVFKGSFLSSKRYDLRLDQLIKSCRSDPVKVRATEYRVCATWRVPTLKEDWRLLKRSAAPSSFAGQSQCFQLDVDAIWPKRKPPLFKCLRRAKRADFLAFVKRLVIELECPPTSRDLDRPGPMEQQLLSMLTDRVGFGRYPNEKRGPVEAAAQLILLASKTRGADPQHSTLSPAQVVAFLGLITDYGRIAQQFPFKAEVFVSMPDLRRKLLEKVKAGGITVLSGGPGAGKSWELTDLMKKLRAQKVIVAVHYCYIEPGDPLVQSRITLNAFYGNLIAEIVDAVPELREHNPTRYAAGPRELQALLDAVGEMKLAPRLVVIVDGLDHIARVLSDARTLAPADAQIARDLLALKLPKNVSVLVGSQPGDHITQLSHSGSVLTVSAWEEPEVKAFLGRIPLGKKLKTLLLRSKGWNDLVAELAKRSQGNALYCTYLCRELQSRLEACPGAAPLTLLRTLPANDGKLSTYYEFLLGSLDDGGRLVGGVLGLIDFGVTPEELQEIFPIFCGMIDKILAQLAPILERTRGQGGLRIYHESFRRHLLEKAAIQPGNLGASLKDVIAWLDGKGFITDPRAFRFLLPNLIRAERANEVLERINRNFVVKAVAEGQPSAAIEANLSLYARVAADARDFPSLVRAGELVACNR